MRAAIMADILLRWLPHAIAAGTTTAVLLGGIAFLLSLLPG